MVWYCPQSMEIKAYTGKGTCKECETQKVKGGRRQAGRSTEGS
jgi:hypothetical protein